MKNDDFMVAASSKSINKTIKDIDNLLEGKYLQPEGPMREELRQKLRDILVDTAKDWLEHGFKGGHIVAAKKFVEHEGVFPEKLSRSIEREFPVRKKGERMEIDLTSKLPKKLFKSINEIG